MSNDISHLLRRDNCPRCLESVSKNQPTCGACDTWLSWGDEAVRTTLRDLRARHQNEYSEAARHWKAERVRLAAPSRFTIWPFAAGFGIAALVFGALIFARPSTSNAKSSTRKVVASGAICNDGSETRAVGSGACSGHGGVSGWLK